MQELIDESSRGVSMKQSQAMHHLNLSATDADEVSKYIQSNPDYTAYHALLALRRKFPDVYDQVPPEARASVLCSALEHVKSLNDWGYLDTDGSYDDEAAKALVSLGKVAIDCLKPILNNRKEALLYGSEMATLSSMYQYRRCDYAYRYISLILGENPSFHKDPRQRDKDIEALKAKL